MDLALEISSVTKKVILSHHLKDPILTKFPDNVIQVYRNLLFQYIGIFNLET